MKRLLIVFMATVVLLSITFLIGGNPASSTPRTSSAPVSFPLTGDCQVTLGSSKGKRVFIVLCALEDKEVK